MPHGELLMRFSEVAASLDASPAQLAVVVADVIEALGALGFVEAAATVANFTMMTRIADGTGTPLDPGTVEPTIALRDAMGIDDLVSARL